MAGTSPDHDTSELEKDIIDAIERGEDVQARVRQLTLARMHQFARDLDSLRTIIAAAARASWAGVRKDLERSGARSDLAKQRLKESVSGLDAALAQFALASRLAIEEAGGHAARASQEEIARIREGLLSLEGMFLEALKQSAAAARVDAGGILADLASHLRIQGSAVGAQVRESLDALRQLTLTTGEAQADLGARLARSTFHHLRQLTADTLNGLADRIKPKT